MAARESDTTPKRLFDDISAGKFKPLYYFYGGEDYRIVEAEKYLAHQFLPDKQLITNYRKINSRKTGCADLLAELSVYPMLGERQVIAVSDIQSYKPTEIDRILKVLTPPDPNRIVIFSTPSARTPKKKSAFMSRIRQAAEDVEFRKLTAGETAAIITRRLNQCGLKILPEALTMLTELIAGNRGALESEVNKLADYRESGDTVTVEDIQKVSAGFQVYSVFNLADEIIAGDSRRVLRQVRALIADGNSATGILFFVGQHFLLLYLVKNGKPLPPNRRFLAGRFRQQAARYDNDRLERILMEIAEADASLRAGGLKPQAALEVLALKLLQEAG